MLEIEWNRTEFRLAGGLGVAEIPKRAGKKHLNNKVAEKRSHETLLVVAFRGNHFEREFHAKSCLFAFQGGVFTSAAIFYLFCQTRSFFLQAKCVDRVLMDQKQLNK